VFAESFKQAVVAGFAPYARAASPAAALEELERFRILAPHREGRHGVVTLNRLVESSLLPRRADGSATIPLLPVMITANNYDLGLYNGDVGVMAAARAKEGQTVYFSAPDAGLRSFSALRLPLHDSAFALTVHKSQGSEFDKVLLILPDQLSDVLCRELLYTAVTRARKGIEIWGDGDVFRRAVERQIERHSGLADRLWKGVQP
jgi:exodeoxyribonuclease V alpha subunit